jgi:spore germination cell wall hydrolase CwlJ-like protein
VQGVGGLMKAGLAQGLLVVLLARASAAWGADGPAPAPIRLLIGGETLAPVAGAAVIRLGVAAGSDLADEPSAMDPDDPLTCLAQAVYYEARSESLEGQRAVAQVVMNRTHLSAFPGSVCGVVFQRARETSGCQFSFVCDGSMNRATDWTAWERAKAVASQALAGQVYKPLAEATHYHAAWMTPYWSSHLARLKRIGGHVFYR